jgi:hypothetical protein
MEKGEAVGKSAGGTKSEDYSRSLRTSANGAVRDDNVKTKSKAKMPG